MMKSIMFLFHFIVVALLAACSSSSIGQAYIHNEGAGIEQTSVSADDLNSTPATQPIGVDLDSLSTFVWGEGIDKNGFLVGTSRL